MTDRRHYEPSVRRRHQLTHRPIGMPQPPTPVALSELPRRCPECGSWWVERDEHMVRCINGHVVYLGREG